MSKRNRKRNKYKAIVKSLEGKTPDKGTRVNYSLGETKVIEKELVLRTFPICWGFPMDELMFSKFYVNALTNLNIMPWDAIITTLSTYLPDARNKIHTEFIKSSKDNNFLVMLDSDVLPPPNFLDVLASHDKPLVGGWYSHKKPDKGLFNPVVYDYKESESIGNWDVNWYKKRKYPGEGLERVDGLGAGCLLMRRDLAEALGERPYDMNSGGEDLVLCKKVYDLGFDIHVDWELACAHVGVSYV